MKGKKGICLLLVFGLLAFYITNSNVLWLSSSAADAQAAIEGFSECVAENDSLALYINREKATFALYHKGAKQTFRSNPLGAEQDTVAKGVNKVLLSSILSVTYYDRAANQLNTANNVSDCLNEGGLSIRLMKNGAEFDFTFPTLKMMIPLQVQLLDNYFSVKVPVSKIEETGVNRVFSIDIAPFFGAGGLQDKGFMLVPDGSGGVIHFNNGKTYANEYAEPVYGADASEVPIVTGNTKETIRLPVFGIKNNDNAVLAVISEGDSQAFIHASTSQKRNSYNNIYSSFEIRKIGSYSLDQGYEGTKNFAVYQETKPTSADNGAYKAVSALDSYDKLNLLKFPQISIDYDTTNKVFQTANEVFEGILDVKIHNNWWWSLGLSNTAIELRGLEDFMVDMYDYPEELHYLMNHLCEGNLKMLSFLEENNLLSQNTQNSYVGSGGFGFTHDIKEKKENITTMDMWGFTESQETVAVSPDMFEEFVFPYQLKIAEKFGLNCYGCCEGLERRWHIIKQIPRLRRVSVSHWADSGKMAEYLGDKYIFSLKPSPSYLSTKVMQEEMAREELRTKLTFAKENNCHIEVIMKDNHTLGNNPHNATRWVEIAREELERLER